MCSPVSLSTGPGPAIQAGLPGVAIVKAWTEYFTSQPSSHSRRPTRKSKNLWCHFRQSNHDQIQEGAEGLDLGLKYHLVPACL
jgi:hypothetical protein